MLKKPVYLDYNATTPCDPDVVDAMIPYFSEHFGNTASRDHSYGWEAGEAVELARRKIARLIGAPSSGMVFTSGATEALNFALKGISETGKPHKNHIITSRTEHEAVLDTCRYLEKKGCTITYLGVDTFGNIDLQELEREIRPETVAIVLMYANNETGLVHPVRQIGKITRKYRVLFVCDATQAVGKIPVNILENNIDLLAFSSHKMYGPKGVGALYMGEEARKRISPLLHGGKHEKGFRSGSLNVPGIVGFGKAAEICYARMDTESRRLERLRNMMENILLTADRLAVNGDTGNRLSHVTNISVDGIEGETFILSLAMDIAVSCGSACSGNVHTPSHVLRAMGMSAEQAGNSLRLSLGRFTTEEEARFAAETIVRAIKERRKRRLITTNG
ncbi:cysteine desulfurase family protein [Sinomicrobium pectinilyticum]|uniref:cysteine desulfurase family protein n=1 Tax=Sinomicrobium pectinilyticum TaxID=1084421 RepID=UPI0019CFA224|nr:cysteine desulfurase family protein [Sinomicrobium pectinilyticum]